MIEKIEKPWGSELKFAHTAHYVGKILEVKGGEALSVQYHKQKVETMHVLSGTGRMVLYVMDEDGEVTVTSIKTMEPNDTLHIPPSTPPNSSYCGRHGYEDCRSVYQPFE